MLKLKASIILYTRYSIPAVNFKPELEGVTASGLPRKHVPFGLTAKRQSGVPHFCTSKGSLSCDCRIC